jgi:hypothetical protein
MPFRWFAFCRMWQYFLGACEMMFSNGSVTAFQIELARNRDGASLTLDDRRHDVRSWRTQWADQALDTRASCEALRLSMGDKI